LPGLLASRLGWIVWLHYCILRKNLGSASFSTIAGP
jgi:hypothetical protein